MKFHEYIQATNAFLFKSWCFTRFYFKGNENIFLYVYQNQTEKKHRSGVQLSDRLTSLGITGEKLRAPLKPHIHHSTIVLRGLRRTQNWTLITREMPVSRIANMTLLFIIIITWSNKNAIENNSPQEAQRICISEEAWPT